MINNAIRAICVLATALTWVVSLASARADNGTERELTPDEVAELMLFASEGPVKLDVDVADTNDLPHGDAFDLLLQAIRRVSSSAIDRNDVLMRATLNRGVEWVEAVELAATQRSRASGTLEARLRMLRGSIRKALGYQSRDVAFLSALRDGQTPPPIPYMEFGLDWTDFSLRASAALLGVRERYVTVRLAMMHLRDDLVKDALLKQILADPGLKLKALLEEMPPQPGTSSDEQLVAQVVRMRKIYGDIKGELQTGIDQVGSKLATDLKRKREAAVAQRTQEKEERVRKRKAREGKDGAVIEVGSIVSWTQPIPSSSRNDSRYYLTSPFLSGIVREVDDRGWAKVEATRGSPIYGCAVGDHSHYEVPISQLGVVAPESVQCEGFDGLLLVPNRGSECAVVVVVDGAKKELETCRLKKLPAFNGPVSSQGR